MTEHLNSLVGKFNADLPAGEVPALLFSEDAVQSKLVGRGVTLPEIRALTVADVRAAVANWRLHQTQHGEKWGGSRRAPNFGPGYFLAILEERRGGGKAPKQISTAEYLARQHGQDIANGD